MIMEHYSCLYNVWLPIWCLQNVSYIKSRLIIILKWLINLFVFDIFGPLQ